MSILTAQASSCPRGDGDDDPQLQAQGHLMQAQKIISVSSMTVLLMALVAASTTAMGQKVSVAFENIKE